LRDHQEIRCAFIDFNVEGTGDTPRFIHHLRSVSPKLKIIGISGYPCEQEFASSGVKQFLMKPWSMSDLDKVLQDQPE
jgi:response regulator RpfG family c-di-GMP phosphodiesterase